jgi:uncharacterized membrane-anchored protein
MLSVDNRQRVQRIGGIVEKATKQMVMAVVLFFVSIWVIMAVGITAVWLTEEVRVFGLVALPTTIVTGLLVVYFDWRAKLLNRIRDERNEFRKAA